MKYFVDLGKIFIVGEKPSFLDWSNPRLVHIPQNDLYPDDKDANLIVKTLKACHNGVSERFVRMSDDQIFLKPVLAKDMTPYYLYDLKTRTDWRNRWAKRLEETKNYLALEKKPTYHYESHFPMICSREKFVSVMGELKGRRVTINTWYFNKVLEMHEKMPENYKMTLEAPMYTFDEKILFSVFLGYNNKGIREGVLKETLQKFFASKCPLEI